MFVEKRAGSGVFATLFAILVVVGGAWSDTTAAVPEATDKLIEQLGDADYEVRERAQAALSELGFEAYDALLEAERCADLEISARAKYLLRLLQSDLIDKKHDSPEVVACLQGFLLLSPRDQAERLRRLSALPDDAGIAALCRLVRFDRSPLRSKRAALAILRRPPPEEAQWPRLAAMIREYLETSRRPASLWLLAYAQWHENPDAAMEALKTLVEQEEAALARADRDTDVQIVARLAAQQLQWAQQRGHPPGVDDAMRMVLRVSGSRPSPIPAALIDQVIQQKAWELLGLEPLAFAERFARDPRIVLYRVAKAHADAGRNDLAASMADTAFALPSEGRMDPLALRLRMAVLLQRDGMFAWAQREYREVTQSKNLNAAYVLDGYLRLAEMFHDQGDHRRAAEVNQEAKRRLNKELPVDRELIKELSVAFGARADYQMACHWAAAGDGAKQREHLDRALDADPNDVDLLIACYRLRDTSAEYRARIRDLIKAAAARIHMRVLATPDDATAYNEFAWLIANTEGDLDEALRLSHKSIELQGGNGGYYDTLARCYFAKGDWEKAVRYQLKAAELEPHGGQIAQQLEQFRQTYTEKTGAAPPEESLSVVGAEPDDAPRAESLDGMLEDDPDARFDTEWPLDR